MCVPEEGWLTRGSRRALKEGLDSSRRVGSDVHLMGQCWPNQRPRHDGHGKGEACDEMWTACSLRNRRLRRTGSSVVAQEARKDVGYRQGGPKSCKSAKNEMPRDPRQFPQKSGAWTAHIWAGWREGEELLRRRRGTGGRGGGEEEGGALGSGG